MQGESTKIYFLRLLKEGHKWQYTSINGVENKPRFYFTSIQWILILISIISSLLMRDGFEKDFVSYILAALSIFVGLFLTLILTAFDKFKQIVLPPRATSEDKRYLRTRKNFFKQFTALTSYAIVISLFCIILLGFIAQSHPTFSDSVLNYQLIKPTTHSILFGMKAIGKTLYNGFVLYFLLDFLILVFYAVTSMHSYMSIEFEKDIQQEDSI